MNKCHSKTGYTSRQGSVEESLRIHRTSGRVPRHRVTQRGPKPGHVADDTITGVDPCPPTPENPREVAQQPKKTPKNERGGSIMREPCRTTDMDDVGAPTHPPPPPPLNMTSRRSACVFSLHPHVIIRNSSDPDMKPRSSGEVSVCLRAFWL